MSVDNIICGVMITYLPNLEDIVRSLNAAAPQVDSLVIIDNGSPEKTVVSLREIVGKLKNAILIRNKTNAGLATGMNQGVAWALKRRCQWTLTLDQDSIAGNSMVRTMLEAYKTLDQETKQKVGILAPNYTTAKGITYQEQQPTFIATAITSGQLVKAETFKRVGLFQENLFIDGIDHEFCFRALAAGLGTLLIPQAVLKQKIGNPKMRTIFGKKFIVPHYPPERYYYIYRNSMVLYKKYFSLTGVRSWIIKNIIANGLVYAKMLFFEEKKLDKTAMILKGLFDGLRNHLGRLPS